MKPQKKVEPKTNQRILQNALAAWKLPRVDTKDPKEIEKRIDDYMKHCMECDQSPTLGGCANWLGVTISTLERWYTGQYGSVEHQQLMVKLYALMQDIWGTNMQEGNINPVSGIFIGKAFFGYKDTQEIVVKSENQEKISTADLIAESRMLPGAEKLQITDAQKEVITAEAREIPTEEAQKEEAKPTRKKTGRPCSDPSLADLTPKERKEIYRKRRMEERRKKLESGYFDD